MPTLEELVIRRHRKRGEPGKWLIETELPYKLGPKLSDQSGRIDVAAFCLWVGLFGEEP